MVAPSFQEMKQVCEPYKVGDKMYVKVEHPRTKKVRQVRWYEATEFAKAFKPKENVEIELGTKNIKKALGFELGYITIFPNGSDETDEWFKLSTARYHVIWGWYFISTENIPLDVPAAAGHPVRLYWADVSTAEDRLKAPTAVRKVVDNLLSANSKSQFQGEVKERIERTLTVTKVVTFDSAYGSGVGYTYTFVDPDENLYSWTTSAKVLTNRTTYQVRGTIKDHKTVKGERVTILTRCFVNEL